MQAKELIDKYNAGLCTPEERTVVESWFDQELRVKSVVEASEDRLAAIKDKLPWMTKSKIRSFNYRWVAAACFIISLGISIHMWQYSKESFDPNTELFTKRANIILPNGQQVELNNHLDAQDSAILSQNGLSVSIEGTIRLLDNPELMSTSAETMTRIETPRGGEYKIELSDGTLVQLNSESSLEFPVQFIKQQRKVKLRGEAYFDVAKDGSKPFVINATDKMAIQVLGTSFNVSAYTDKVSTTLLEGSVQVNALDATPGDPVVIKPGETASMTTSGAIKVVKLDMDRELAWKDGLFNFNNCTLAEVAEELERWYDIQVVVEQHIEKVKFYGEFERKQPLNHTIKLLEAVGIKAKLNGRVLRLYERN